MTKPESGNERTGAGGGGETKREDRDEIIKLLKYERGCLEVKAARIGYAIEYLEMFT